MHNLNLPSIDEKNPLYCPAVSATAYLDSIRHLHRGTSRTSKNKKSRNNQLLVSFARVLDKALLSGDSGDESDVFPPRSLVRPASPDSSEEDTITVNSQYSIPTWERFNEDDDSYSLDDQWVGMRGVPIPPRRRQNGLKRKRSPFSDINGPSKHARSIQSVHDSSFDITARRENLVYSVPGSAKKWRRDPQSASGLVGSAGKPSSRKTPQSGKNKSTLLARIRNLEGIYIASMVIYGTKSDYMRLNGL